MNNIVDKFKEEQNMGDIDLENKDNIVSLDKDGNIIISADSFNSIVLNKETCEIIMKSFLTNIISNKLNLYINDLVINDQSINLDLLNNKFTKRKSINNNEIITGDRKIQTSLLTYSYDPILKQKVLIKRPGETFFAYDKKLLPKVDEKTGLSNNTDDLIDAVKSRYNFLNK